MITTIVIMKWSVVQFAFYRWQANKLENILQGANLISIQTVCAGGGGDGGGGAYQKHHRLFNIKQKWQNKTNAIFSFTCDLPLAN